MTPLVPVRIGGRWLKRARRETPDSLTQCVTGAMRPLLGSHKVMFDLELGTPMSQSHRNAVARTPGPIYRDSCRPWRPTRISADTTEH